MPYQTRFGEATPDEKIVSKLVMQPGTSRGIDQFNKLYEGVPEAQILLRQGILDVFSSQMINKGKLDSTQIRGFLNNYKEVFDKVPDLRNTFMNADALTSALVNRQATIIRKGKLFANQSISPYAKLAGFSSSKAAVEAGLSDPKIMQVLTRNAKSKEEQKDLTTLIADIVMEQPDPWNYLLDNEKTLARHFNQVTPGHFQKLKNIAEAQTILTRYHPKKVPSERVSQDAFYKKFGTTFASATSQLRWAYFYNKTSVYYPVADMGSKYLNKIKNEQVDRLMERALYDSDLAATASDLATMKTIDARDFKILGLLNDLGLRAINNGIRVSTVIASPEETQ